MAASKSAPPEIDPETEQILIAAAKAKSAAKKKARSPDPSRRMKADPRDPRCDPQQWPCYGKHQPGAPQSNLHGEWIHCEVCNLRLLYTPRKGSPANSTATNNGPMVKLMLRELQHLLGTTRPTAKVCHHMMNKITAEAVLAKSIRDLKSSVVTGGYSSPTSTTWGLVDNEINHDEELIAALEAECDQTM